MTTALEKEHTVTLKISDLIPHPRNPRTTLTNIDELTTSIKENGMLLPLLVSKRDGKNFILGGHRRHAALKRLETTHVEAFVHEGLTEEQELEIMTIDNLQREGIHPLDQTDLIAYLRSKGHTVEAIAEKISKTPLFVSEHIALLKLTKNFKKLFRDGGMNFDQAKILSNTTQVYQAELYHNQVHSTRGGKSILVMSAFDLQQEFEQEMNNLSSVPWKLNDTKLNTKVACEVCPCRSKNNNLLFDIKGDKCTDSDCFKTRGLSFLARAKKEAPKGTVQLSEDYYTGIDHVLPNEKWMKATGKEKPEDVKTGIIVDGKDMGRLIKFVEPKKAAAAAKPKLTDVEKEKRAKEWFEEELDRRQRYEFIKQLVSLKKPLKLSEAVMQRVAQVDGVYSKPWLRYMNVTVKELAYHSKIAENLIIAASGNPLNKLFALLLFTDIIMSGAQSAEVASILKFPGYSNIRSEVREKFKAELKAKKEKRTKKGAKK